MKNVAHLQCVLLLVSSMAVLIVSSSQVDEDYPLMNPYSQYKLEPDVYDSFAKRAWNSGFSGGMGKRAWNSGFTGGLGKRAWNSGFSGGMGKRAWNSGFTGGLGKRAWNSGFTGGMGK